MLVIFANPRFIKLAVHRLSKSVFESEWNAEVTRFRLFASGRKCPPVLQSADSLGTLSQRPVASRIFSRLRCIAKLARGDVKHAQGRLFAHHQAPILRSARFPQNDAAVAVKRLVMSPRLAQAGGAGGVLGTRRTGQAPTRGGETWGPSRKKAMASNASA